MLKFYCNVKWACQMVLQYSKANENMRYSSKDQPLECSRELFLQRFYVQVETVLCSIRRLECTIQEKAFGYFDKKRKISGNNGARVRPEISQSFELDEFTEASMDEQDVAAVIDLLSSGIIYLLLAEVVLEESPPSITAHIQSNSTPEVTHKLLFKWLMKKGIKPLHPQRQDLLIPEDLSSKDSFYEEAHESLIEILLHTYINNSLCIDDILEAIEAINEIEDTKLRDYPFDLEDALLNWINQIVHTFHKSIGQVDQFQPIEYDLWKGISNGAMLLKVIIAYHPKVLSEDNVSFTEKNSLKDKTLIWEKITQICDKRLNVLPSFPAIVAASADDLLFKSNIIAFVVDIFSALVYEVMEDEEEDMDHFEEESKEKSGYRTEESVIFNEQEEEEENTESLETDDNVLLESIRLDTRATHRAASSSSNRYRALQRSCMAIEHKSLPSTSKKLEPAPKEVIVVENKCSSEEVLTPEKMPEKQKTLELISEEEPAKTFTLFEKGETAVAKPIKEQNIVHQEQNQNRIALRRSMVPTARFSMVFHDKELLKNAAASISGGLSSKSNSKIMNNIPETDDKIREILEQKQRENALLKLRLQEQERMIEKEREELRNLLEKERIKIEQKAVRDFIISNKNKKKEEEHGTNTRNGNIEEHPQMQNKEKELIDNNNNKNSQESTNSSTDYEGKERPKSSDNKWNKQAAVIQIMPTKDTFFNQAEKMKRQKKLEELRRQKIEEENRRKQELMRQKQQLHVRPSSATNQQGNGNNSGVIQKNMKKKIRTNRQLIKNAICHVCLAGKVNEKEKTEILAILQSQETCENTDAQQYHHFVILVRDDKSPVFKALYTIDNINGYIASADNQTSQDSSTNSVTSGSQFTQLKKLIGKGPRALTPDMVKAFFRYDSGGKRFIMQPTKSFGVTTDAVVLSEHVTRKLKKK